jgi:Sulfatase-modifying factor enzyme 1
MLRRPRIACAGLGCALAWLASAPAQAGAPRAAPALTAAPRSGDAVRSVHSAAPASAAPAARKRLGATRHRGCPSEMVHVHDFCIDRWEVSLVDRKTGRPLSPYYPPVRRLLERVWEVWQVERFETGDEGARAMPLPDLSTWQLGHAFEPKAVSAPGVVPQGYLSYYTARRACENAGKRLCTRDEWITACEGEHQTRFPYGPTYRSGACNIDRLYHPGFVLHGNASVGHLDPRLNLVVERGVDPVLRLTGATHGCVSRWGNDRIYDMVGNVDEWVDDEDGMFVGGFYSRATTKGCEAKVSVHAPGYFDYSLGTRCCRDAEPSR